MISVMAVSVLIDAGRPSRWKMPAIPHIPNPLAVMVFREILDLRLGATLLDLVDMALTPLDQPAQTFVEIDCGCEADLLLRALGRSNAVADQRGLAPRGVVDRLVRAGEVQQLFGDFLQRGALPGSNIIE